jgi:hypothetical protein
MSDYTVERCVCPAGFGPDNDWYHIPNCAKPDNAGRDLLIVMCVVSISIFLVFIYFIKYQLKRTARTIGIIAAFQLWLFIAVEVCLYAQNGAYEAHSIILSLFFCSCAYLARLIVLSAIQPVSKFNTSISLEKYTTFFNVQTAVTIVGLLVLGIPPAVFAREEDPYQTFNYLMHVFGGFYWLAAIVVLAGVLFVTGKLKKAILGVRSDLGDKKMADKYTDMLYRIKMLQLSAVCVCVPYALLSVVVPVLMTMWGSVPFYYVIYFLQLILGCIFFTVAVFMFAKPGRIKNTTEQDRTTLKSSGLHRARKAIEKHPENPVNTVLTVEGVLISNLE